MGGIYGISKAAKLNEAGDYDQAVLEATKAIALDADDPEPLVERAFACAQLERYSEAVADLEKALVLDETAQILESALVDDAYFSALLGAAKVAAATSPDEGVKLLSRYATTLPKGAHLKEAGEWQKRLRGEAPKEWVKRRLEDA
jgi:tetratricopeptide (TPR) repeat protein